MDEAPHRLPPEELLHPARGQSYRRLQIRVDPVTGRPPLAGHLETGQLHPIEPAAQQGERLVSGFAHLGYYVGNEIRQLPVVTAGAAPAELLLCTPDVGNDSHIRQ